MNIPSRSVLLPAGNPAEPAPQSLRGSAGHGFYYPQPKETGVVILTMITVGLAGTIGVGLYWIAHFAGWL